MGPDGVITFDTSTTGYDCDFPDDVQTQGGTGPPHLGNLAQASANAYANLRDIRDRLSMGTINSFRCYSFLYRGGLSPITLINAILAYNTLGQGTIRQQPGVPSPGIGASTGNAQYAIVLNTEGGYFARRAGVNPPGGYGTLAEAQKYVMVHEVGHLTGAIAVDTRLATQAANDAAQRLNDRDINANCGGFIRGLP